jgi:release factor glutamine methyltransferase
MTIQAAYQQLIQQLLSLYENGEAVAIADLVIEHLTGINKNERLLRKEKTLSLEEEDQLQHFTQQLLENKPVQYVLQEAWFADMKFMVTEAVLIPRPETEELVELILNDYKKNIHTTEAFSILDIGTGSGCIPISLKKKIPNTAITAIDISEATIAIAKKNAVANEVNIHFMRIDFLDEYSWQSLETYNYIVSNPPYIAQAESAEMEQNVLSYEPHLALFVADSDPLIFYRKIAAFGITHLKRNGVVFVEINQALGKETVELFSSFGYQCILRKDMQGKDRMIVAKIVL